ncbi:MULTISPECIES: hypothetical protein [unclassified Janthinobacterium]|uniref:hypothetical protein n=1 Tax=unclassified Janthinobacterium TaxID=2610881 RepID=UPI0016225FE9|nr:MULTISPECIES: hypothetical protein [unclassified Janthinobacterium]MBB5607259.1 hypothetical protein [Janthinobacterium sp. S3T4]MBB5615456.1 hypothetical protein [Janthinobacterium sp. S3M3]
MNKMPPQHAAKDQVLPASLAGQLAGWSLKAQQYPVFSRSWFSCRVRSFLWPMAIFTVIVLIIAGVI